MSEVAVETKPVAVVPVTYSSRREVLDGIHELYPSRLSLMVFDAACYFAEGNGVDNIVIAGEQSYSDHDSTTGDLLHRHIQPHHDLEIKVLRDEQNRLLNTPHQVDALINEFSPDDVVTVICWGFHEGRLRDGFEFSSRSPQVNFIHAEDIIDSIWFDDNLWQSEDERLAVFSTRYDVDVDWPTIKQTGLKSFESREKLTRIAMKFGKNGWLIKLLTNIRRRGRYDDINKVGLPLMETTN